MNTIQGINNDLEQGVRIHHEAEKSCVIHMGTEHHTDVSLHTYADKTTLSCHELRLDMKHLRISSLESNALFPYVSVTSSGKLIVQSFDYWYIVAFGLVLGKMYWDIL